MKFNLTYLVYGRESEFHRALLSIASFFAWFEGERSNVRLLIYTDQPAFFEKHLAAFNPCCYFLNEDELGRMLDGTTYIHRRKVKVIEKTFKMYPDDAIVFIDADTFFTQDPVTVLSSLSPGISLMHTREFTFINGQSLFASFGQTDEPSAFIAFIEKNPLEIDGDFVQFSRRDYCWNSGLIGLHPGMSRYLPDILKATDQIYENSYWFISEQVAFSLVLGAKTKIVESKSILRHYWDKREKAFIDELLTQALPGFAVAEPKFIQRLTERFSAQVGKHILISDMAHHLSARQYKSFVKVFIKSLLNNPVNILLIPQVMNFKSMKYD